MRILPRGMVRIRHLGILASYAKPLSLPLIHQELEMQASP
ncbi:hypothetical protein G9Q97_06255 [Cyclobacterium sp. GBPx2]|uniref:Uncharacterized protein n=2 Tax=Cyclobacterium plantarum TaxID=2716263 RepID=A0ABX0H3M4_9BACT|nr:hypothetical protein [Cyclobacterium plantarum]